MAKINKYWGYVAIGALTAAAAGAVAALIAKKGSCKEDFDFEDDFDDFDLTDEKETAKEDQEPAEDFQSWEHTGEQSATDDTESDPRNGKKRGNYRIHRICGSGKRTFCRKRISDDADAERGGALPSSI